jgi:pyridoxal phosphate enzyme (YggS family)
MPIDVNETLGARLPGLHSGGLAEGAPERLAEVRARISRSAIDARRSPRDVTLVCVSKTFGMDALIPVLEAGERVFGENRVQEANGKWPDLKARYPGIELHLIGPLQSNKVREAVELFDIIETIDRSKIAEAIAAELRRSGKSPKLFIEINTGSEPQKAGVLPEDADAFIIYCRDDLGLTIEGLMCIPPEEEQRSPHFALLSAIARRNGLGSVSMGMSADYELAIQCGATHVRVGSAIFGSRAPVTG